MSAHYVYRVYNRDYRLIYVGSTANLFGRLDTHRRNSWWAHQGAKVQAVVYPCKSIAAAAESTAIKQEAPRWNIKGRYVANAHWSKSDFVDYLTSLLNQPGSSPARVRHIHQAGRMYRARFNERVPLALPNHPDGTEEDRWLEPMTNVELIAAVREKIAAAGAA